jgi:hypothetical protein
MRAAYLSLTWEQLRMIKACYDPTKLFWLNQNISSMPEIAGSDTVVGAAIM